MQRRRFTVLLLAAGLLGALAAAAYAAERVALVVGNAAYEQELAVLRNPVNDATAVAAVLRRLGFEVIEGRDLDENDFYDKIAAFEDAARSASLALFFYAGHGLQVDGRNYLAPVDLKLKRKQDLKRGAVELADVREVMRSETNLVILDACRDNPLAGELARSLGLSRTAATSRGLARVESASGMLIAYATEPGDVAADGLGEHSPYTEALLEHLETPGLSVQDLFTQVTASVLANTGEKQKPWTHSSLSKIVRLVPGDTPGPRAETLTERESVSQRLTAEGLAAERVFWESVKDGTNAADFEAYLSQYPQGRFALLARNRLKALQGAVAPALPQAAAASVEAGLELSREDRRLIQLGLTEEGFDPGPADGLFGRGTRDALSRWQASRGEAVTGHLDAESVKVLLASGRQHQLQGSERQAEVASELDTEQSGEAKESQQEHWALLQQFMNRPSVEGYIDLTMSFKRKIRSMVGVEELYRTGEEEEPFFLTIEILFPHIRPQGYGVDPSACFHAFAPLREDLTNVHKFVDYRDCFAYGWNGYSNLPDNYKKLLDSLKRLTQFTGIRQQQEQALGRLLVPGWRFHDCLDCPEMVVVPAGSFMMGSPVLEEERDEYEDPQHEVLIAEPFAAGATEVTRGQFDTEVLQSGLPIVE